MVSETGTASVIATERGIAMASVTGAMVEACRTATRIVVAIERRLEPWTARPIEAGVAAETGLAIAAFRITTGSRGRAGRRGVWRGQCQFGKIQ